MDSGPLLRRHGPFVWILVARLVLTDAWLVVLLHLAALTTDPPPADAEITEP